MMSKFPGSDHSCRRRYVNKLLAERKKNKNKETSRSGLLPPVEYLRNDSRIHMASRKSSSDYPWTNNSSFSESSFQKRYLEYRNANVEDMEWNDSCLDESHSPHRLHCLPQMISNNTHHRNSITRQRTSPSSLFSSLKISDIPNSQSDLPGSSVMSFTKRSRSCTAPNQYVGRLPSFEPFSLKKNSFLSLGDHCSKLEERSVEQEPSSFVNSSVKNELDFTDLLPEQNRIESDDVSCNSFLENPEMISNELNEIMSNSELGRRSPCRIIAAIIMLLTALTAIYFGVTLHMNCRNYINLEGLEHDLVKKVHGQHIAVKIVINSLSDLLSSTYDNESKNNLLVLSFQGWTGIGKNHLSNVIGAHLPSTNVQKLIIPLHFPHSSPQDIENFHRWIITNATESCGLHLFIIDEVDKASDDLIQSLRATLFHLDNSLRDLQSTKALVLLLSNTGGSVINSLTLNALSLGRKREDITFDDIEQQLVSSLRNTWCEGFLIDKLIHHLVPFLPLERNHVKKCIEAALEYRKHPQSEDVVNKVLEKLQFFPPSTGLFSKTGCRKVSLQLDLVLE